MYKIVYLIIISVAISFVSCSQDYDVEDNYSKGQETIVMKFEGLKPCFSENRTRATSHTPWTNGDKIYLRFNTVDGVVIAKALFDEINGIWTVNLNGALKVTQESKVEIYFFGNAPDYDEWVVWIRTYYPIFEDKNGSYSFSSNGELIVNGALRSLTSRLTLDKINESDINSSKEETQTFTISGLNLYQYFEVETGRLVSVSGCHIDYTLSYTVSSNGNVDYSGTKWIYSNLSEDSKSISITRHGEKEGFDFCYSRICSNDMFVVGHSGRLRVPSYDDHEGWTMKQVTGKENGKTWVDLGLPSGNLWAIENVGADFSKWITDYNDNSLYGAYFCWGYNQESISSSITDISGTIHDYAKKELGGRWVMPTHSDYDELFNLQYGYGSYDNTWLYSKAMGLNIYGKTGEKLFLPEAGYYKDGKYIFEYSGRYWDSTLKSKGEPYCLTFSRTIENGVCTKSMIDWMATENKNNKCSIRAVIKTNK